MQPRDILTLCKITYLSMSSSHFSKTPIGTLLRGPFNSSLFQIASAMTTCTRVEGRVWTSPPPGAGSGAMSMTGPRATTPGPAATAPPTTGAARPAGSRSHSRGEKVGGE